ncbi:2-oxo acid dehydrogenase subunit E2 [Pseudomonas silvicola]|nr:2-oxo acid dehydrogenase subunit E2 [Pseudomonas silvicola]
MSLIEVTVPDIGDFKNLPVIELLVAAGDRIEKDQTLASLESDKAVIDIPAPESGVVESVKVVLGDQVSKGTLLMTLTKLLGAEQAQTSPASIAEQTAAPAEAAPPVAEAPAPAQPSAPAHSPASASIGETAQANAVVHAGPAARRLARELGVDMAAVAGSGRRGRVSRDDVKHYVKATLAKPSGLANGDGGLGLMAWPQVDFSKFGPVERKPLSRIKAISGAALHRNWVRIPHVTNHDEADITELENLRLQSADNLAKTGAKVTLLAFLIKACSVALRKFPQFNASLEGNDLVLKQYCHIGFAADTPNGLMVPVIRDVDRLGVVEIAAQIRELAGAARDGKLKPEQMQGGCFSVSSLGGIGGAHFTPIINAPEVAILGIGRAVLKPSWVGDADSGRCVPRLQLPLSLSWDHRAVDGSEAGQFLTWLKGALEDFRRISL